MRVCGDCVRCCVHYPLKEELFTKPPRTRCLYLRTTGKGCSIYNDPKKPKLCSEFKCSWLAGSDEDFPDWLRPDKADIIFRSLGSHTVSGLTLRVLFGSLVFPFDLISSEVKHHLKELNRKGYIFLLLHEAKGVADPDIQWISLIPKELEALTQQDLIRLYWETTKDELLRLSQE